MLQTSQSRSFCRPFQRYLAIFLLSILGIWIFLHNSNARAPTVTLVIAAMKDSDFSWAHNLNVPNTQVIPYIADDETATFHPTANKGHEAMAYLTYIYTAYDILPDVSIFVHDADNAWHNDPILESSLTYTLNHLNLDEVKERGYLSLRVDWQNGCPNWINTSITTSSPSYSEFRKEEALMGPFFQQMFPGKPVPPIFSGPCCSQFAATRAAIHALPRSWYKKQIEFLETTELDDAVSGRLYEHMWPYMFNGVAVDCPIEYKALCRQYHICFKSQDDLDVWNGVQATLERSQEQVDSDRANGYINDKLMHAMEELKPKLKMWKEDALERGRSRWVRWKLAGDL